MRLEARVFLLTLIPLAWAYFLATRLLRESHVDGDPLADMAILQNRGPSA